MPTRAPPHLITLIFLTALSTVSLNMFLPSLAGITTDLGTSYAVASFAVAGYLAVTAVLQLVLGPLSDRIGRRPVLLFALGTFAMASVGCAFATDIRVFLGFRMLQGGVIAGYALSLAIVRDTTSEQKAAGLIGYISMAMALAPMVGPVLGGILDTTFGWRANFVFYALAGIALFVLCWVDLGETKSAQVPRSGTDAAKVLLKVPLFWAYALCSAFSTGAFYIFLTGAPLVAAQEFGVSTAELGFYIGSITVGFMAGGFIAGRSAGTVSPGFLIVGGRVVACGGLFVGIGCVLTGILTPMVYFSCTILVGLGNGITIPAASAGAMSVKPALSGSAAGLSGALIVAGGAALTTLTSALLPDEGPALFLLLLMLAASMAGLVFALMAVRLRSRAT